MHREGRSGSFWGRQKRDERKDIGRIVAISSRIRGYGKAGYEGNSPEERKRKTTVKVHPE
jgi:hypothetical protein